MDRLVIALIPFLRSRDQRTQSKAPVARPALVTE